MIRVTFKTNRGIFTKDYEHFNFKIGDCVFVQSPYYTFKGDFEVINIRIY